MIRRYLPLIFSPPQCPRWIAKSYAENRDLAIPIERVCRLLIITALVIGFLIPTVAQACPSCKLIEAPIARGFSWSILFLMAMPFTVFGVIGGSVFYVYRRANRIHQHPADSVAD